MNSHSIADLPELAGASQLIRIPAELDVPITPRVRAVLDSPSVQRLKQISQLGLVRHVYPGAVHSRFEHSLGVYRLAGIVFHHLHRCQPAIVDSLSVDDVKVFLLAALLHDVGHWPYCHPIEDMRLPWVPRHEDLARSLICEGELAKVIENQWEIPAEAVANFLSKPASGGGVRALQNVMNGPVDIDKMDYLQRDSLHAGVPYGRNFDSARLITSLRVTPGNAAIGITEKGKTAAEMMVFARYVMFSEVYWHHAVRSATAMLQRLVFRLSENCSTEAWLNMSDIEFAQCMSNAAPQNSDLQPLAESLFSNRRKLYKRFAQYNFAENPDVHQALGRRPYEQLLQCSEKLGQRLSRKLSRPLSPNAVLIDAPPVKLEVQFNLPVICTAPDDRSKPTIVSLAEISPVVNSLATDQFDNFVKKVRVFVAEDRHAEVSVHQQELTDMLLDCAAEI